MIYDCIVIGGGPAGMFAAITAAKNGSRVLLLEKNDRLGKKLLITGKGRCNVTNNCDEQEILRNIPRNGRFLYSALDAMPPQRIMDFFESHGCPLKTERGNRVFPVSDKAQSVLDCLRSELRSSGVIVRTARVREILTEDGAVSGVRTDTETLETRRVILATGGLSYPTTGSTGDGFAMAKALGHTVTPTEGSLVPLEVAGSDCPDMQGLSLRNCGVKLLNAKGKVLYKDFGELLFTHFGVSGPTVLSASCHLKGEGCRLVIDLKPAVEIEDLTVRIGCLWNEISKDKRNANKLYKDRFRILLTKVLPMSLIPGFSKLNPGADHKTLAKALKNWKFEIAGFVGYERCVITAGGISLDEITAKTLESKLIPGLYFAGEVLDLDADTGGYNLQTAFSTGYLAGISAAK
jgi:predicted Rossmann fold flavoprotein